VRQQRCVGHRLPWNVPIAGVIENLAPKFLRGVRATGSRHHRESGAAHAPPGRALMPERTLDCLWVRNPRLCLLPSCRGHGRNITIAIQLGLVSTPRLAPLQRPMSRGDKALAPPHPPPPTPARNEAGYLLMAKIVWPGGWFLLVTRTAAAPLYSGRCFWHGPWQRGAPGQTPKLTARLRQHGPVHSMLESTVRSTREPKTKA